VIKVKLKNINLGLIGLGYVGKMHLRHSLNLAHGRLVAVSDVSRKALANARRMGIRDTFSDYRQLLTNSNVDAVIIALPTHLHKSCTVLSAEAGKDVFLEKPLARDPVEGRKIVRAVEKHGTKLMVGYPYRFNPSFRDLKEQLQMGLLGDVQTAVATFVGTGPPFMHRAESYDPRPVPSWWFDKRLTGGGALIDLGCHLINLLRWYFGEIVDIKGYLGYRFNLGFEDYAICMAKFASGEIATINVGWFSLDFQVRVEMFGTVKHAFAERRSPKKTMHAIQLITGKSSKFYLPHLWELEHFVYCVGNDIKPTPSGQDALKDLEAISKAYDDPIQLGSPVPVYSKS
jgi:myo-inositol 2-dehydrogenase/D-chiro-inositol 1-dehydrogenase